MNQTRSYIGAILIFFIFTGCERDPFDLNHLPEIRLQPVSVVEGDQLPDLYPYPIRLEKPCAVDLVMYCSSQAISAVAGEDYIDLNDEPVSMPAGQTYLEIPLGILGDTLMEFTEQFEISIQYDYQGVNRSARAVITIENDDYIHPKLNTDGYTTSLQYPGMKLIWHDEFDQGQINSDHWNYDAPNAFPMNCGGSDDEIGRYTGDIDHLTVRDGKLFLSASYDPETGIYRSTRVNTKEKVNIRYGRIDFRAKLAPGNGLASSLLLLGKEADWPTGGEIDVLKMAGKDCSSIYCSLVYEEGSVKTFEKKSSLPDPSSDLTGYFHLYTLLWEEDRITWLLDYIPYYSVNRETFPDEYIFNHEFFLKINLAVGGNFAGMPDAATEFPASMEIDYVRVYQPDETMYNDE
jgi:hypothetical protein